MDDLLAARSQMAMSLAFHIVFAAIGMAMPWLMVIAEIVGWRTGDPGWIALARKWGKGTGMMFAIGAVSGTALSFELGLLWPRFMAAGGDVVGLPFAMEGFAFFLEAIFLGIYLYGWDKVPRPAHVAAGVGVGVCGVMSGAFVICANGWMNTPTGFRIGPDGDLVDIDPVAAMLNPAAIPEALHMIVAAFLSVGFLVAGIHAWVLLKRPDSVFHRRALAIALAVGVPAAFLQPATGHLSAQTVAETQPVKLAAMEAHWETETWAPFRIGGWPYEDKEVTRYAIEIPGMLSLLSFDDPNAVIRGLKEFPRDERPPVAVVHVAFQVMVGSGMALLGLSVAAIGLFAWRRRLPDHPLFLKGLVLATPLGMIGIEAGWTVTEVGRQPWVVQGILRTANAVTPMPWLWAPFLVFSALYLVLAAVVVRLFWHLVEESEEAH